MILNSTFNTLMFYWTAGCAAYAAAGGDWTSVSFQFVIGLWFIYIGSSPKDAEAE